MKYHIIALAVVSSVGLLGACREEEQVETPVPLAVPFNATIDDSLVAATVEYMGTVDTLSAQAFRGNLDRLNALFPEVMQDEARSAPIRHEMVRQYALERLLLGEAARRGLTADSAAVDRELQRYKMRFASEDEYLAELNDIHQSEEDLRLQFAASISREALIRSIEESLAKPTPDEISSFQDQMSTALRVQHILVGVPENASGKDLDAARERALSLLDSLESGRPFAILARQYSDDPGSKISGGELPWFRRGEMVAEFEKAAFGLASEGDYTRKPVRTPYGYHLIRLLERREDRVITADSARALLMKRRVRASHEDLQRRLVGNAVVRTNPALIPEAAS